MDAQAGQVEFVGAVLVNSHGRAYMQRRSSDRAVFPNGWDVVGGKVEDGETATESLVREIREETGIATRFDINWFTCRYVRLQTTTAHECLAWIRVDQGDEPLRLEEGKFSESAWVDSTDERLIDNLRLGYNDHIPSAVLMALYLSSTDRDA